jgi:hypothetical protein
MDWGGLDDVQERLPLREAYMKPLEEEPLEEERVEEERVEEERVEDPWEEASKRSIAMPWREAPKHSPWREAPHAMEGGFQALALVYLVNGSSSLSGLLLFSRPPVPQSPLPPSPFPLAW